MGGSGTHCQSQGPCSDSHYGDKAPELSEEDKKLALALLCNGAMAKLKVGELDGAKFDCSKALEFDPANIKALVLRGKAKLALGEHDAAMEDAARVLELDSTNKDVETL